MYGQIFISLRKYFEITENFYLNGIKTGIPEFSPIIIKFSHCWRKYLNQNIVSSTPHRHEYQRTRC